MPLKPTIEYRGDQAYYHRKTDTVTLPQKQLFYPKEAYYNTLFHELAHSTGHQKRLNRKELMQHAGFSSALYAREELTAELAAAFLCGICRLNPATLKNSAAYLKEWLTALQNDKTLLLKAASQAQAAVDYILGSPANYPPSNLPTTKTNKAATVTP